MGTTNASGLPWNGTLVVPPRGVLKMRSDVSKRTALALIVTLLAAASFAAKAAAQPTATPTPVADPCQSASVAKQSVAISLLGSTESIELIAASNQGVHVCGFLIDGGRFLLFYGRGLNCSWNPVPLFGPTVTTGKNAYSGPGTIFLVPQNNELCMSTPSGSAVSGILTYTQP